MEELNFSIHLNIPVVMLFLQNPDSVHLAHCLFSHCSSLKGNQGVSHNNFFQFLM